MLVVFIIFLLYHGSLIKILKGGFLMLIDQKRVKAWRVVVASTSAAFLLWQLSRWYSSEPTLSTETPETAVTSYLGAMYLAATKQLQLVDAGLGVALQTLEHQMWDLEHHQMWEPLQKMLEPLQAFGSYIQYQAWRGLHTLGDMIFGSDIQYQAWRKWHTFGDMMYDDPQFILRMAERTHADRQRAGIKEGPFSDILTTKRYSSPRSNAEPHCNAFRYVMEHNMEEFKKIDFRVDAPFGALYRTLVELLIQDVFSRHEDIVILGQLISMNRPEFFLLKGIGKKGEIQWRLQNAILRKDMDILDLITKEAAILNLITAEANLLPSDLQYNFLDLAVEHFDLSDPLSSVLIERFARSATDKDFSFVAEKCSSQKILSILKAARPEIMDDSTSPSRPVFRRA